MNPAAPLIGICSQFFGFLFLSASAMKALSLGRFVQSLLLVPYLPHQWARPVAFLIPVLEAIAGSLLLVDSVYGTVLAIGLLLLFAAVACVAHGTRQSVPCNCFGLDTDENLSIATAIRNVVLAVILAGIAAVPVRETSLLTTLYALITLLLVAVLALACRNYREHLNAFGVTPR